MSKFLLIKIDKSRGSSKILRDFISKIKNQYNDYFFFINILKLVINEDLSTSCFNFNAEIFSLKFFESLMYEFNSSFFDIALCSFFSFSNLFLPVFIKKKITKILNIKL